MKQGKIDYLNVAKGIGILLVVIGHALTKDIVHGNYLLSALRNLIYTIHMPLFFVIAGLLFNRNFHRYIKEGIVDFACKKGKLYIIPYLSMTALVTVMFLFLSKVPVICNYFTIPVAIKNGGSSFVKAILFFQNPIDEHLWFAYIMFLVLIIGFVIQCMREGNRKLYIGIIIILCCAYILTYCIQSQYIIKKTIRYMMYFQFGGNIDNLEEELNISYGKKLCVTILYAASFLMYQFFFSYNDNMMVIQGVLLLIIGISGSLVLMELSKVICEKSKLLMRIFSRLNDVSYPVYLYQQPFVISGTVAVLEKVKLNSALIIFIATLVGVFVPVFLYKVIVQKNKVLRLLFAGSR